MDNKALADFIRTEFSKLKNSIDKLVIRIASLHTPGKQDSAGIAPQSDANNENDPARRESAFHAQVPPAPGNTQQSNNPWYKTLNGWKTVLEIAALPFAISYAVVTYFQWKDLRDHFEIEQRAWIKVECSLLGEEIPRTTVPMKITNFGKSPTLRVVVIGRSAVISNNNSPSFQPQKGDMLAHFASLFPNDTIPFPINHVLSEIEISSLTRGDSYLAIFGQAAYVDQFGWHWTRFCTWKGYDPNVIVQAGPCVTWNGVGDGTPPKDISPQK